MKELVFLLIIVAYVFLISVFLYVSTRSILISPFDTFFKSIRARLALLFIVLGMKLGKTKKTNKANNNFVNMSNIGFDEYFTKIIIEASSILFELHDALAAEHAYLSGSNIHADKYDTSDEMTREAINKFAGIFGLSVIIREQMGSNVTPEEILTILAETITEVEDIVAKRSSCIKNSFDGSESSFASIHHYDSMIRDTISKATTRMLHPIF